MDLFYMLFAIVPGLIIYSTLRNETDIGQKPEYVVLIYGIFASIPFFAIISKILILIYGECSKQLLLDILNKPLYILCYFILVCLYSAIVLLLAILWKRQIKPKISEKISRASGKHSHQTCYNSAWSKIYNDYLDDYKILVGRLLKDGNLVTLGQIEIMTSDDSIFKDISFLYREEYSAYFPENQTPLLKNLCNYVDLNTGYILELYDGESQINLLKKKSD
jgi:hypothetical protein